MISPRILFLSVLVSTLFATGCAGQKIRQLRTEKQMLSAEVMQLQQDLAATQERRAAAEKRAQELFSGSEEDRTRAAQLQREMERAQGELSATKLALSTSMDSRAQEFAQRISQGLEREQELKAAVDALESKLAQAEHEQLKAEEGLRLAQEEVAAAGRNLSQSEQTRAQLSKTLEEANSTRTGLEQELATLRTEKAAVDQQLADATSGLRQVRDQVAALQLKETELTAKVAELTMSLGTEQAAAKSAQAEAARLARTIAAPEKVQAAVVAARAALAPQISAGLAEVNEDGTAGIVRLVLYSDGLFDRGTTMISDGGRASLAAVDGLLASTPYRRLEVAGHTDNVPVQNMPYADNWELAAARAAEVVRWLYNRPSVDEKKLVAESYSYFAPLAGNDTAAGRQRNRRVEVVIHLQP